MSCNCHWTGIILLATTLINTFQRPATITEGAASFQVAKTSKRWNQATRAANRRRCETLRYAGTYVSKPDTSLGRGTSYGPTSSVSGARRRWSLRSLGTTRDATTRRISGEIGFCNNKGHYDESKYNGCNPSPRNQQQSSWYTFAGSETDSASSTRHRWSQCPEQLPMTTRLITHKTGYVFLVRTFFSCNNFVACIKCSSCNVPSGMLCDLHHSSIRVILYWICMAEGAMRHQHRQWTESVRTHLVSMNRSFVS